MRRLIFYIFPEIICYIELQKRRGKGGVITIWPQKFSHKIKKLEKDERFVVIEVLADKHKMILINNYYCELPHIFLLKPIVYLNVLYS
jgi:hypothetical protein